jgi:hypothetical protein
MGLIGMLTMELCICKVLHGFPTGCIGCIFIALPLYEVAKARRLAATVEPCVQDTSDLIFVGIVDLNGWWGVDDAIRDRRSLFGFKEVGVEDVVNVPKPEGEA